MKIIVGEDLPNAALDYHRYPTPGKISVSPTKAMATQRDLSLAYSPGVAEACLAIVTNPSEAGNLTARNNLVAVITNGTAVLGLGSIGPLASKPVMEGKGCLFKKFAGIDVFDIELEEIDPDKLIDTIVRMEPTFGGINLEDIKAPECFHVERKLRERMKIPVFHDDQHGTAIVVAAAILNGLKLVGKDITQVIMVVSGAGAAALACLDLIVSLGLRRENVFVSDILGVVYIGRQGQMDEYKSRYARHTAARTLAEVMPGCDIFLGLSAGGVLTSDMIKGMARRPLIFAMANPDPEILPEVALATRPDAIIGTGRSDYPNQINNVLCFPFIFRGALDCGATTINEAMKVAAVHAIAALTHIEIPETVALAYGVRGLHFGVHYLIPKPFDPRLMEVVAPAVAAAAAASGVAKRPITDLTAYQQRLKQFVFRTSSAMQPVFAAAKRTGRGRLPRVVYAEGEDERVLRAAQVAIDEELARPLLIGCASVINFRIAECGLRMRLGIDCACVDFEEQGNSDEFTESSQLLDRLRHLSREAALAPVHAQSTLFGALMLRNGFADALLCGTSGLCASHLKPIREIIGMRAGVHTLATMQMLILPERQLFICDTHVNLDPTAEQVAEIAMLAAAEVRRMGIEPRVALLSHSNFGNSDAPSALKMRAALALAGIHDPTLAIAGEMRGDSALSCDAFEREASEVTLAGGANLLVMPNLDAANIAYNLLRIAAGNGITVGGILLGAAQPAHILSPSATVRRIVNMTALAAMQADAHRPKGRK